MGATRVAEGWAGRGCAAAEGSWEGHGGGHPPPPPPSPPQGGSVPLVGEGRGGGQPPVNTVDVPVEGLAPPPPHTHWGRWTPWPPHNALTRVTGPSSEICCFFRSRSNTHPQAPPYRCRPPCFWAVMRPCVCGAEGGGGRSDVVGRVGGPLKQLYRPPHFGGGGGGGLRYYAYLFRCIIAISILYRSRLGAVGGGGRRVVAGIAMLPCSIHIDVYQLQATLLQTIDHGGFTADQCLQTTHQMPPPPQILSVRAPPPPPHTHTCCLFYAPPPLPPPPPGGQWDMWREAHWHRPQQYTKHQGFMPTLPPPVPADRFRRPIPIKVTS